MLIYIYIALEQIPHKTLHINLYVGHKKLPHKTMRVHSTEGGEERGVSILYTMDYDCNNYTQWIMMVIIIYYGL